MPTTVQIAPAYVDDLEAALAFYTGPLGLEVQDDVTMGPAMRWLTVAAPGAQTRLLIALVDHHIPETDRDAMRRLVAKGLLAVFLTVDDVDATFEAARAAGADVLQEPTDQVYGLRDCAVRDPSGNHVRVGQWLGG